MLCPRNSPSAEDTGQKVLQGFVSGAVVSLHGSPDESPIVPGLTSAGYALGKELSPTLTDVVAIGYKIGVAISTKELSLPLMSSEFGSKMGGQVGLEYNFDTRKLTGSSAILWFIHKW